MRVLDISNKVIVHNNDETLQLATKIGRDLKGGETIALCGPLGSGKTQIAKGIALGLGIPNALELVTSPTFNIMQTYKKGRFPLYHWDWYRIQSASDVLELGFNEQDQESIHLIEWAEKFQQLCVDTTLWIYIDYSSSISERIIQLSMEPIVSQ